MTGPADRTLTDDGVTAQTADALRAAMQRLFAGQPQRTDGRLTKQNLWQEAGVSRATMNRAQTILAEWDAHVAEHGTITRGEARRDDEIADLKRKLADKTRECGTLRAPWTRPPPPSPPSTTTTRCCGRIWQSAAAPSFRCIGPAAMNTTGLDRPESPAGHSRTKGTCGYEFLTTAALAVINTPGLKREETPCPLASSHGGAGHYCDARPGGHVAALGGLVR